MMTNFTFKTIVLVVFSFLLTTASFAQKPVSAPASLSPSIGKQAALNKFLSDDSVDPNDTIADIDTVMLLEKSSSDMHFRIDPKEGATMWRYRPLGDLPADAEVEADLWTSGMSMDTCCISLENLDAETEYVVQFGRMGIGQTDPAIWYSMVEMTRCMGPSLDQLKLVGLDHSSASMMVEMESEAFDWVLKRVGSSTARHIETTTNNIEWTNLPANTAHECRVRYMCGGIWSDYSSADIFTTNEYEEIHCDTLTNDHVYTSDINTNYVKLNCSMAGNKYSWGLREAGSNSWTIFTTETDHYNWTSLKSGKTYEYKVKVECQEDSWTGWSNTHYFTTKEDYGNSCYAPTSSYMAVKNISYNSASTYCVMDGYEYHWAIKPYGSNVWIDHTTTKNYHHWTGLHYNTKYEYKVKVKCHSGSWTGWSNSYWFTTHDHYQNSCTTPQSHHMSVKDLTYHSAITHCSVDGYEYHWMLKEYGSSHWVDYTSHDNFYSWTNLHYNTKYEYKVKVKCHSGSWTGWSAGYWFTTPDHYGSCTTPQSHHMSVKDLTYNSASTHCSVDGYGYHWMLKPYGSNEWQDYESSYNHHTWTGLHYNTKYEYKVKVKCYNGSWTGWSDSYWFTTPDHYDYGCSTPQSHHMSVKDLTYNSATTHCSVDGYEYHWQLKPYGSSQWKDHSGPDPYHNWTGLNYNTKYEYKVKVKCHSGSWTGWSASYWFTTPDHYDNSCSTPQSHHMSVKDLTYNSATTYCSVDGYEYHWQLKPYGSSQWMDHTSNYGYHQWNGLQYNTKYEYKVKVKCHSGSWTGWSASYWFTTPDHYGSCSTPQSHHMSVKNITYNSASTHCSIDGYEYHWALRKYGSYSWTDHTSHYNYHDWSNLHYNTKYEYKVKVKCHDGSWTDWSDGYWFTTHDHYSNCSTPESHHMTADNISYNSATTHCGVSGMEYHWMMRPHGGSSWSDYTTTNNYHNWTGLQYNTKYEYKVKVKCSSTTWTNWSGSYYFTTHDHAGYGCSTPSGYDFTIYQQEYNLFRIYMYAPFTKWSSQIRKAGSYEWAQHTTTVDNMAWGNLTPNTEYEYRVNRTCSDGTTSGWSGIRTFWTGTGSLGLSGRDIGTTSLEIETGIQIVETNEINVFPNPASEFFSISGVKSGSEITLIDMQGKIVLRKVVGNQQQISLAGLENGLYQIMAIDNSGERQIKRLAVVK